MSDHDFPHFGAVLHCGVVYDRTGAGVTARGCGDPAFWAMMDPETFLALATPLPVPRESLEWLARHVSLGGAIAPSELAVRLTPRGPAAVSRHEGRHRMTLVRKIVPGRKVPVRITVIGQSFDEVPREVVSAIREGMRSQRGGRLVNGPLFGEAESDLGGVRRSGVPPPLLSVGSPDGLHREEGRVVASDAIGLVVGPPALPVASVVIRLLAVVLLGQPAEDDHARGFRIHFEGKGNGSGLLEPVEDEALFPVRPVAHGLRPVPERDREYVPEGVLAVV